MLGRGRTVRRWPRACSPQRRLMQREDAPAPLRRRGPRPLWLHLTLAMQPYSDWQSVLMSLSSSSASWTPGQPATLAHLLPEGATAPDAALLAGVAAYRRHPWHRQLDDPPTIWSEGSSRLLDYGPPGAPPLLVVPSLVNRATILDLMPDHSMLRFLANCGIRPLLLDWGYPGEAERSFSLSDYIAGRLVRALESVGSPVDLAGYCMGGLMATAAATRDHENAAADAGEQPETIRVHAISLDERKTLHSSRPAARCAMFSRSYG